MRWGMCGFEEQEQTRPQYRGIRYVPNNNVFLKVKIQQMFLRCCQHGSSLVLTFHLRT